MALHRPPQGEMGMNAGRIPARTSQKWLAGLCLLLSVARVAAGSDTLTLNQAQLGNIFSSSESVQIPLQTTGDHVSWTATDFYGAAVNGGPIAVDANGNATIQPGLNRLGYFALHVVALRGGNAVAAGDTTFAVVAPVTSVASMGDSPFGVCTHFAQGMSTSLMPLIARAGIAQFRDEEYWQSTEPTLTSTPTYVFPDEFTSYMASAAAQGLNPLMEFDFANSNYDGGYTPYTAAGENAFADYGVALLNHYGSQIKAVDVWNEYNGSYCTGTAQSNPPLYYTQLLEAAYTAVKAQNAKELVIGGACVPLPIPWFEDLFGYGALDYMDAADIHPYVYPPEGLETSLASLQTLMAQYNHGNGAKPIWATECGDTDPVNPGRQAMASYLVRIITLMRTAGVARAYWYLICDDAYDSSGLLRGPTDALGEYAPSSAYPAYANLIQQLYGATYVQRESTDPRTRFYVFKRSTDQAQVGVVWSTASTAQLILSTSAPLTLINIMGEATVLQPVNGLVAITADINPSYVIGPVTAVREVGRDVLVADSAAEFSGTQGTQPGTWQYGTYIGDITAYGTNSNYLSFFKQMAWTRTATEYCWTDPNYYASLIDNNGAHPSTRPLDDGNGNYTQAWVVRRWQSNAAGKAHFVGTVGRSSPYGDGTGATVFVDGQQVYSASIAPGTTVSFDFTAPILTGSTVDFVANCGPATDLNFDYVYYPAQVSVPAPTPTTFAAWQSENFTAAEIVNPAIGGVMAMPAGDGVPNLFKYAAGLAPKVPSATSFTTRGVEGTGPGAMYQTLSYRYATAATDLTFTIEVNSGDLTNPSAWQTGGVLFGTPVDNGDGTMTVTYRDNYPIGPANPHRFMRLRVTQSSGASNSARRRVKKVR